MSEVVHLKFPLDIAKRRATGSSGRRDSYLRQARNSTMCWLNYPGKKVVITTNRGLVTCKKCRRSMERSGL